MADLRNGAIPKMRKTALMKPSPSEPRVRRNRPRNAARMSAFITKRSVNGGRINPGQNPPPLSFQSWNPQVLVIPFKGDYSCTPIDLAKALRKQLDPTKRGFNWFDTKATEHEAFRVQLRLDMVRVWNISGRMVALSVNDFVDDTAGTQTGERDQVCGLIDTATQQSTACIGYQLPHHLKSMVLRNDDLQKDNKLFHITAGRTDGCIIYLNIHWRFDGPTELPTFDQTMYQLIQGINVKTGNILKQNQEKLGSILRTLEEFREGAKETTTSKIFNGITKIVPIVATVAAAEEDEWNGDNVRQTLERIESHLQQLSIAPSTSSYVKVDDELESV